MSSFDDRECPHPSCAIVIPSDWFACPRHWRTLPPELKRGINRAWSNILAKGGIGRLEAAQAEAIAWWHQ